MAGHNLIPRSEGVLQSVLYTVICFMWLVKKPRVAKILQAIWEIFLYENNCNYNSYKFSYKFTWTTILSFCRNQEQESSFPQVGGLVTNIFVFCL